MGTQLTPKKKTIRVRWDGHLITASRLIFGLSSALLIASLILYVTILLNGVDNMETSIVILVAGAIIANGIVGLLIISRYPTHFVGWLLLFLCFAITLNALGNILFELVKYGLVKSSNFVVAIFLWTNNWVWFGMVMVLLVFIPLYFPDGRLLSRRWRIVALAGLIGTVANIVSLAIVPEIMDVAANDLDLITPTMRLAGILNRYISTPLTTVAVVGAIISIILRYRRSGQAERAQMKWVFSTILLGILVISWADSVPLLFPAMQTFIDNFSYQIFLLFPIALPVVIGIAIMRYRLYDIDIIIRRTLVYSLVTLALLAVYFSSIVLLQRLFTGVTGQQSPLAIVISTLLIAALFNPLRQRVQSIIDRRFFRKKYDAQQVLEQFGRTARDETDRELLTAELARVLQDTIQPEHLSIWIHEEA